MKLEPLPPLTPEQQAKYARFNLLAPIWVAWIVAGVLLLVLACGCRRPEPATPAARSSVAPRYSAWPPAVVAVTRSDVMPTPGPDPGPAPEPEPSGETCQRCSGTGKVQTGDGLRWVTCSDCGGDGKQSVGDLRLLLNVERERQANTANEFREYLEKSKLADSSAQPPTDESNRVPPAEPTRTTTRPPVASIETQLAELDRKWEAKWSGQQMPPPAEAPTQTIRWRQGLTGLAEARQQADETGLPVVVFFTAESCVPCKPYKANVLSSERVSRVIADRYAAAVEVDAEQYPEAADDWQVEQLPTLFVVSAGDWVSNRVTIADADRTARELLGFVNQPKRYKRSSLATQRAPTSFASSTTRCNCAVTGVCTCGDDCQCPDCPRHRITYVQYGSAGGAPTYQQLAHAYGSSGGVAGYQQRMYSQPAYYSAPQYRYAAPVYYPQTYAQPAYTRRLVCGPTGCFFQ